MKLKKIVIGFILIYVSIASQAQDRRTVGTRVADLLAQFPSTEVGNTNKLMNDMLSLGDAGMRQICNQVIPLGSGDDIKPRYAVESLSRYLSQSGKESDKTKWEQLCISYAVNQKDYSVKDFFMKQLQLIGTNASIEPMKVYLTDRNICSPAVAVISAVGGSLAEKVLSEALKDPALPCAASVMNSLALMKSDGAVNEFIAWYSNGDKNIQTSALNALAQTGSPLALPVLSKAAKAVSYNWERSGATASLLVYAKIVGSKGDIKTMGKICKTIIKHCNVRSNIQYKTAALETLVNYWGYEAMAFLLEAARHPDKSYRNAAYLFSLSVPGTAVTRKWIENYPGAITAAKPEIIAMLDSRKDELAVPLISASLSDNDPDVRKEAASAIIKIRGNEAIPSLIEYMIRFTGDDDQEAAKSALMSVMDSRRIPELLPVLTTAPPAAVKSAVELIARGREEKYFGVILPFTSSAEEKVKASAYEALADIAGPADQEKLIELLTKTDSQVLIADVQIALTNAANKISDPEKRSELLINTINDPLKPDATGHNDLKSKIIPVLAKTEEEMR